MKKLAPYIWLLIFLFIFYGCQDKYLMTTVQPAKGSLKATNDSCLPKLVAGIYKVDRAMNDSNFIQVTINVTVPGTYSIQTDSVAGISFKASGSLSVTGLNTIKLAAAGKPNSTGNKLFTIRFDGTVCLLNIAVDPAIASAVYTLQGSPSACLLDTVSGTYAAGAELDTSNHIVVTINASSIGIYSISTTAVNGYSFAASGTLTATGVQTITLQGSGTPLTAGTDNFSIKGANTSCTIPVNVVAPIVVAGNEYFPITMNSYWNYDNLYNVGDTLGRIITGQSSLGGNLFQVMNEVDQRIPAVQYFYRKSDSGYYEYTSVDKYTRALTFTPTVKDQLLFLKSNLASGDTWRSAEYTGQISSGQTIYLQYNFTCNNANAAVTINGKTFAHVYKITMLPMVRSAITYPYASTSEVITTYYAKGVGIIYYQFLNRSFTVVERQIRNWVVY